MGSVLCAAWPDDHTLCVVVSGGMRRPFRSTLCPLQPLSPLSSPFFPLVIVLLLLLSPLVLCVLLTLICDFFFFSLRRCCHTTITQTEIGKYLEPTPATPI